MIAVLEDGPAAGLRYETTRGIKLPMRLPMWYTPNGGWVRLNADYCKPLPDDVVMYQARGIGGGSAEEGEDGTVLYRVVP